MPAGTMLHSWKAKIPVVMMREDLLNTKTFVAQRAQYVIRPVLASASKGKSDSQRRDSKSAFQNNQFLKAAAALPLLISAAPAHATAGMQQC